MLINLIDEQLAEITRNDLKENYDIMFDDYITCVKTKSSVNYCSDDYKVEKKELEKLLNSFRVVMEFYGIEIENTKRVKSKEAKRWN